MLEYFCVHNNALISNSLPFQRPMRWRDGAVHLESPETGTVLQHIVTRVMIPVRVDDSRCREFSKNESRYSRKQRMSS